MRCVCDSGARPTGRGAGAQQNSAESINSAASAAPVRGTLLINRTLGICSTLVSTLQPLHCTCAWIAVSCALDGCELLGVQAKAFNMHKVSACRAPVSTIQSASHPAVCRAQHRANHRQPSCSTTRHCAAHGEDSNNEKSQRQPISPHRLSRRPRGAQFLPLLPN